MALQTTVMSDLGSKEVGEPSCGKQDYSLVTVIPNYYSPVIRNGNVLTECYISRGGSGLGVTVREEIRLSEQSMLCSAVHLIVLVATSSQYPSPLLVW